MFLLINSIMGSNFVGFLSVFLTVAVLAQGVPAAVNHTSASTFKNSSGITFRLDRSFNEKVKILGKTIEEFINKAENAGSYCTENATSLLKTFEQNLNKIIRDISSTKNSTLLNPQDISTVIALEQAIGNFSAALDVGTVEILSLYESEYKRKLLTQLKITQKNVEEEAKKRQITWCNFNAKNETVLKIQKNADRSITSIQNEGFQYLHNIFDQAVGRIRNELSVNDKLTRIEQIRNSIEVRIAFQVAMFSEIQQRNDLYTQNALILARHMKSTMEDDDYHSVTFEMRYSHEEIKNKLPLSLKNIVFSDTICIKNEQFDEYLFASTDLLEPVGIFGASQRYAYTGVPGVVSEPSKFKWRARITDNFQVMLYNIDYDEPLYAEYELHEPYPEHRTSREVFTRNKNRYYTHSDQQDHWVIEVYGDSIRFKNVLYRNEYLYASMNSKMDRDRRRVYVDPFSNTTGRTSPGSFDWIIEDCS